MRLIGDVGRDSVMSLSGKTVMITGAGGGIGRAVASAFARERADIFATDVKEETARQTGKEVVAVGGNCVADRLDVRSETDIQRSVGRCLEALGKVDILVNCAGILTILPFDKITQELWDGTMEVNARGTFQTCKAVASHMVTRGGGGKIVNVSSIAGKNGGAYYTHYCASKFAVIGITKSLALELAPHGINVNAVCPGDVQTEMLEYEFRTHSRIRGIPEEELRKQWAARVPLGRLALPEDVADIIVFLASRKADYMTGQSLNVSGGMVMF
ncbi:MAG: 3-oxoacyl-ACP reductase FabG [Nitrososphaerota archaeon]|nr:3-oxoacyl-ACP reductase FabG [Nitrososphaerota archaeon]